MITDWRTRVGDYMRARKTPLRKTERLVLLAVSRSCVTPQLQRQFVAVLGLRESLQLHIAGPLVVQARTYVPLASVTGGEIIKCLTGRFAHYMTSAPGEPPGEQDAQDAEDKSCEAEGDVNGVVSREATGGEASHGGGGRGSGNIYTQQLAPRPHPDESFLKKRRVSAVAGAFIYNALRSPSGKGEWKETDKSGDYLCHMMVIQ